MGGQTAGGGATAAGVVRSPGQAQAQGGGSQASQQPSPPQAVAQQQAQQHSAPSQPQSPVQTQLSQQLASGQQQQQPQLPLPGQQVVVQQQQLVSPSLPQNGKPPQVPAQQQQQQQIRPQQQVSSRPFVQQKQQQSKQQLPKAVNGQAAASKQQQSAVAQQQKKLSPLVLPASAPAGASTPHQQQQRSFPSVAAGTTITACNSWSWLDLKKFEEALAQVDENDAGRWEKVAALVPQMTPAEVQREYDRLCEDVQVLETGNVPMADFRETTASTPVAMVARPLTPSGTPMTATPVDDALLAHGMSADRPPTANGRLAQERRKGVPWTEEEHKRFLVGLTRFGKGDWRSISRECVITRTPTQVASHAQKYFIRLSSTGKDKRRSSIHDITSIGQDGLPRQTPASAQMQGQPGVGVPIARAPSTGQSPADGVPTAGFAPAPIMGVPGTPVVHPGYTPQAQMVPAVPTQGVPVQYMAPAPAIRQ